MRMENSKTPTLEATLRRLDKLDSRLKQLEEKQRLPESYFARDLNRSVQQTESRPHCRSLTSALREVHFKGTLMDRLRLLENRIFQLSYELDRGSAASSSMEEIDEIEWIPYTKDRKREMFDLDKRPDKSSDKFHQSFPSHQGRKSNSKAKEQKQGLAAGENKAPLKNRKVKRPDNNHACRRWFAIGC